MPVGLIDLRLVQMRDGRVFIGGGRRAGALSEPIADDILTYSSVLDTFTRPGNVTPAKLRLPRTEHTTTLLGDGRVLSLGGLTSVGGAESATRSYEYFSPGPDTVSLGSAQLPLALRLHTTTLLNDGRVLVTGGHAATTTSACSLFDPRLQLFKNAASLNQPREGHVAHLLQDGTVFVTGGLPSGAGGAETEIYDPARDVWTPISGAAHRNRASVTLLPTGQMLIAGGVAASGTRLQSLEVFDPKTQAFTSIGPVLSTPRSEQRAVRMNGVDALILGGVNPTALATDTVEKFVYGPQPNRPPIALVPPAISALRRQTARLDGSRSSDPDGPAFVYLWTRPDGKTSGTFTGATSSVAFFSTTTSGPYRFQLLLTDPARATATAFTTVTIQPNQRPIAITRPLQAGTGGTFSLDGRQSGDPEGDPITYGWSQQSGPSVAVNNSTSAVASISVSTTSTTYRFLLTVTDDGSLSAMAPATVVITTNHQPVSDAGGPIRLRLRNVASLDRVVLDGGRSFDPDAGDTLLYRWTQTAGPSVPLSTPNSSTARFVPTTAGIYLFSLLVDDQRGLSASSTARVTVDPFNRPPSANPGNVTTGDVGTTVILDGTGSGDPDGDPLTYAWTFLSGPSTPSQLGNNNARLAVRATVAGVYTFELAVTDDHFATSRATIDVTMRAVNQPPTADAGPDTTAPVNTLVVLNGGNSSDPENQPLGFRWRQLSTLGVSGTPPVSFPRLAFTPTQVGRYVFRLVVTDPPGLTASDDVTVTVVASNSPPIPVPGQDLTNAPLGVPVALDGGRSFDPDPGDRITAYQWALVSAPAQAPLTGELASLVHFTPLVVGVYVLDLTVHDSRSGVGSARIQVIVGGGNRPPVAQAGNDRTVAVTTEVVLNGFGSRDPDGDPIAYAWRQLAGTEVQLLDSRTPAARFTPTTTGLRAFELSVADGKGGVSTAAVRITVVAPSAISTVDAQGFWSRVADIPTPRRAFAAVAVRGKLYTFGGSRGGPLQALSTVEIFDPLGGPIGAWTSGPPMPTPRIGPTAVVVGTRIFVIGGKTVQLGAPADTSIVEVFDTVSQSWSSGPPDLLPRRHLAAAVLDGKIYAAGGVSSTGQTTAATSFAERFDPLDPQRGWTAETPLLLARRPALTALNGRLYVIGGETVNGSNQDRVEIFTPGSGAANGAITALGRWDAALGTAARKPTSTAGHAAAALRGRVYAAGGSIGLAVSNVVERYDPFGNRWEPAPPMLAARAELALVNVDGALYALGGFYTDRLGNERAAAFVERFDAGDDHPDTIAAVKPGDTVDFRGSLDAAIERGGDVDFFRFGVPAPNTTVQVDTGPPDSSEDTVLSIFAADGRRIATVDDPRPGVRLASATFVATAPGDYFASVRLFDPRARGLYSIRVRPAPPLVDDLPNFATLSAPAVSSTTPVTGSLEVPGDVDFLRVQLEAGKDYVFRTALGTLQDSVLALLGPGTANPRPLRENDDGPDGGLASRVDFSATETGTYFLRVRSFDPRAAGTYSVFIEELAPKVFTDDHPNRPAGLRQADTLTHAGNTLNGAIESAGDVDFFRIVAQSASSYAFVATASGALKLQLTLFDRDGNSVLADARDSRTGGVSIRGFRPSFPGTYFMRVKSAPKVDGDGSPATGAYTLQSLLEGTESPAGFTLARQRTGDNLVATVVLETLPSNTGGLRSVEFGLRYDPALLELTSVTPGTVTTAGQLLRFASPSGFLGMSIAAQEQELGAKGTLVNVTFRTLASSPLTTQAVILAFISAQSGLTRVTDLAPEAQPSPGQVVRIRLDGGQLGATIADPLDAGSSVRRPFVRLDGRGSFDPNQPPQALSYAWTVTTAPVAVTLSDPASPIPTFAPAVPGLYEFALTVANEELRSLPRIVRVLVGETNHPPTALARVANPAKNLRSLSGSAPLTFVAAVDSVQLDGRLSADPDVADRGRLAFSWTQVGGPAVTLLPNGHASVVSFVPAAPAVYEFELVVTDRSGARSAADRVRLIALSAFDSMPVLSLSASSTTTLATGTDLSDFLDSSTPNQSLRVSLPTRITLKAKVADPDIGTLPLKQQVGYEFNQESGPPVSLTTGILNNDISGVAVTNFEPTTAGVHVFSATVSTLTSEGVATGVQVRREIRVVVDGETRRLPLASARVAVGGRGKAPTRMLQKAGDAPIASEGDTLTLDGSLSSDPDGLSNLSHKWTQLAGPSAELSNPFGSVTTFVAPTIGDGQARTYAFQLLVDDATGEGEPSLVSFNVGAAAAQSATTRAASYTGGLNLIGVPLAAATTGASRLQQELFDQAGATFVVRVVSQSGRGRFSVFLPGLGMTDPAVEGNQGYLIGRPSLFKSLVFTGQPWPDAARSVTLVPGVNLISFPAGVPSTWTSQTLVDKVSAAGGAAGFVARTIPDASDASQGSPGAGAFQVYLPGLGATPFPLRSGRGYLLSVTKSTAFALPKGD
ncbi:MAG: hypothetical protein HY303_00930 [Candidatus Wallbacteria bacterium]|nr:hypothetical protein [Candidatus Wallbacteria bacterium]